MKTAKQKRAKQIDRADLVKRLREIVDLLLEEECDCPPEWPRCGPCRARLKLTVAIRKVDR